MSNALLRLMKVNDASLLSISFDIVSVSSSPAISVECFIAKTVLTGV